jgi:hypothetical protein
MSELDDGGGGCVEYVLHGGERDGWVPEVLARGGGVVNRFSPRHAFSSLRET